jgi:cellulose synthase (UDP-forming)
VRVALLDDGGSPAMADLARRCGAAYVQRTVHQGAKAGNINHALRSTDGELVAIFDCDHVPHPSFLERTIGHLDDPDVALVQTPQYYANADEHPIAAAAWSQQSLFFGAIARGKDARGTMICCGTNMVFRRSALEALGGFPEQSVTEDFELSIRLHERGWRTAYVPEVLAAGLGPEDTASYVSQQHRWARGCLSALPAVVRARLPFRVRLQYLLSSMYFLTGWTFLAYMAFPAIRILTGDQPLAATTADQFLLHFAPYFGFALMAVAVSGAGAYTFSAFALQAASFWIHIHASLLALLRRPGRFVVTPKQGARRRQPGAVAPGLLVLLALVGTAAYGLSRDRTPATLNNVAFALLHVSVLTAGVRPALQRRGGGAAVGRADTGERPAEPSEVAAAA